MPRDHGYKALDPLPLSPLFPDSNRAAKRPQSLIGALRFRHHPSAIPVRIEVTAVPFGHLLLSLPLAPSLRAWPIFPMRRSIASSSTSSPAFAPPQSTRRRRRRPSRSAPRPPLFSPHRATSVAACCASEEGPQWPHASTTRRRPPFSGRYPGDPLPLLSSPSDRDPMVDLQP